MLDILKKWFLSKFHVHEYEVINEDEIEVWATPKGRYPIKRYRVFTQKCKVCNHIKSYKVEI